ncbi:MAG: hypothetical protein AAF663_04270 [Planctomycetota bacterium]
MAVDALIEIDSVKLTQEAKAKDAVAKIVEVDKNALAMKLTHPRINTPEVKAVHGLKVTKNADPKPAVPGFSGEAVFKQRFEGKSELTIEWIATDEIDDGEKFLRTLAAAALTAGVGVVTGGIGSAVLSGLVTAAGGFFAKEVGPPKESKDDIVVAARGTVDLTEASLAAGEDIVVTLKPPKMIKVWKYKKKPAPRPRSRTSPAKQSFVEAGRINASQTFATVTLRVKPMNTA